MQETYEYHLHGIQDTCKGIAPVPPASECNFHARGCPFNSARGGSLFRSELAVVGGACVSDEVPLHYWKQLMLCMEFASVS